MADRTVIAVAALVRGGRVLLAHRHPERRWYPDCWDLVGGHVEPGESPREAVVRECTEELGVRVLADPAALPDILRAVGTTSELDTVTDDSGRDDGST